MALKKYYVKIDLNHFEMDIKPATMPTSLDFGYRYLTNYTKHKYRVNDINLNDGTLVSYSNKQIHVWTSADMLNNAKGFNPYEKDQLNEVEFQKQELPAKSLFVCRFFEVSKSHQIAYITYSQVRGLYFIASTDLKLHVLNDFLCYIGWWPIKTRSVNFMEYIDESQTLLTAGVDGCYMYQVNFKKTFDPKQSLVLDPDGQQFDAKLGQMKRLESTPLWIKGLKVLKKQEKIFTWSQVKATFHDLQGKLIFEYENMTKFEDYLTDVIINDRYNYFITSTMSGLILVWKYYAKKTLVH